MKRTKMITSLMLIAAVVLGCFIPFSASVSAKKIEYSNSKGTATVICGKYKKTFKAKDYISNVGKKSMGRALNTALEVAAKKATDKKKATVILSKGYYTFDRTIVIYSNTELVAKGCVTKYNWNIVRAGFDKGKQSAKGYKGARNITVTGGTWDVAIPYKNAFRIGKTKAKLGHCTFRFAHCKNVVVRNATFIDNYTNHDIELGGVDGADIYNCKFYNRKSVNKVAADGSESIQADICYQKAMPNYPTYDLTPCKNITIRNNTFKNKLRAVGSHHAIPGNRYDNIRVYNNKMTNIGRLAINGMYWTNARIYNNTLTNVGAGIDLIAFGDHNMYNEKKVSKKTIIEGLKDSKTYIYGNKVTIRNKNNTLTNFRSGVRARGTDCSTKKLQPRNKNVPNGVYYIYNAYLGVTPKGKKAPNKVSGAYNSGVDLRYAVNSRVSCNNTNMNKCTYNVAYGLFIDHCQNTLVSKNTAKVTNKATKIQRSGATIRGGKNIKFTDNKINVTDYGVQHIYGPTGVKISRNDITSTRSNCVYLSGKDDPTPKVKKAMSIVDNDFQSPEHNRAIDAAIRILAANMNVTAHSNGIINQSFNGLYIKELEITDISTSTDDDNNYIKWKSSINCEKYLIYRTVSGKKTLIGDTELKSFTDKFSKSATYTVVPYAVSTDMKIMGWSESEKATKD